MMGCDTATESTHRITTSLFSQITIPRSYYSTSFMFEITMFEITIRKIKEIY